MVGNPAYHFCLNYVILMTNLYKHIFEGFNHSDVNETVDWIEFMVIEEQYNYLNARKKATLVEYRDTLWFKSNEYIGMY